MNNKGQVLVLFVLLIPVLLMLGAYIVDTSYISYHKNRLDGINQMVIKDSKEQELTKNEIEEYIKKNDDSIEIESINIANTKIEITLKKEIKSLFGIIIGKKNYKLVSTKTVEIPNSSVSTE